MRLNKKLKSLIVGQIYRTRQETMDRVLEFKAAELCRLHLLGGFKTAYELLPKEWQVTSSWIDVEIGSKRHRLWFSSADDQRTCPVNIIRLTKEEADRYYVTDWLKYMNRYEKETEIIASKARRVMDSVSTTEKLLAVWPEAGNYMD